MVSQIDIRLLGKGGCEDISRDHLQDDPQQRKRYACRKLPTQDKVSPQPRYRHETKAPGIRNRVSIYERPKEADGSRFGDWEMGFIVDKDSNAILTMVERSTNFLVMGKLKYGKKAMRWPRRYGGCCCPTWESISRRSQRITEASLQSMSGLHIGWHWISISRMHTPHGKKELSRTPTSLSGCIFPKGTDIIRNIALAG